MGPADRLNPTTRPEPYIGCWTRENPKQTVDGGNFMKAECQSW